MNSLERVRTVLAGGLPDRVPVDLHDFMMAGRASGIPFPELFRDGGAMAAAQLDAWHEFGHDVLLVENGTAALAEACGAEVEYSLESAPVVVGPRASLDDLRVPDPHRDAPLPELLKATRLIAEEVGDRACVIGRADQGPFSLATMLMGMVEFLTAVGEGDRQQELDRLLEFALETVHRYAVAQMEQGAHLTSIGESIAGPDVLSPADYRRYAWPYEQRLVARLRADGIPLSLHICGDATRIVGDMVETGAAVLELDYKVDLARVKEATRGRATILGPVDPSGVLALGTPAGVESAAREALEALAPGGGLILGPGCALPPETPAENVHALVQAAHEFGRY
ncbi:MAG TPA: uroporphyrinogen decarboxylase family protein [Gaiellaceae bacterium]|nr:uroporphyrinogen decarboxylase family protein [Gaiellaceae bacterium]